MVDEVAPDSFEGAQTRSKKRKKQIGHVGNIVQEIEICSDSNEPIKRLRIREKRLVDSKKITPDYANPDVLHKTSTSKPATPIVDSANSKIKEAGNIAPGDNSPRKEQEKSRLISPVDEEVDAVWQNFMASNPSLARHLSNMAANRTSEDGPPQVKPASVQDGSPSTGKQS